MRWLLSTLGLTATMVFQTFLCRGVLLWALKDSSADGLQLRRGSQNKQPVESKRGFRNVDHLEDYPIIEQRRFKSFLFPSVSKIPVTNVDQLRSVVLDQKRELKDVQIVQQLAREQSHSALQNHEVLQLMSERFHSHSTPGNREDNSTLALAMEGGGMRGCVSAGMAAAIASLGLTDTIDSIYGSSAGSVIGAYMISRQMCLDVYVDILPAAKKSFVCKRRLVRSLATSLVNLLVRGMKVKNRNVPKSMLKPRLPGMNISFVLDGIMSQDHGIRPIDMAKFQENNEKQPLRVVSSCIDSKGQMYSKCFGTKDFFNSTAMQKTDGSRRGLLACLDASMTVPGATGPPVQLTNGVGEALPCFDAFCFEPIPYRSAVEEGATHVLALCSRPEGFQPKTKPGVYEQGVAPLYFHSHGLPKVANYFEKGGQQYVYAEDLLLLEQGKSSFSSPVLVPPPKIVYGTNQTPESLRELVDREQVWKKAHLLPLKVPLGTPELPCLEQDKDAVLHAVRGGFSAAFDLLAPIVGLQLDTTMSGDQVARLVFPDDEESPCEHTLLQTKVHVPGETIAEAARRRTTPLGMHISGYSHSNLSHTLLMSLPGFQDGRFGHLAKGLLYGSSLDGETSQ